MPFIGQRQYVIVSLCLHDHVTPDFLPICIHGSRAMKWLILIAAAGCLIALAIWAARPVTTVGPTLSVGQSYREAELTAVRAGYIPYPDPDAVPSTPQGFAVTLPDGRKLIVYRDLHIDWVISMQVKLPAFSKDGEWVYRAVDSFDLPNRATPSP